MRIFGHYVPVAVIVLALAEFVAAYLAFEIAAVLLPGMGDRPASANFWRAPDALTFALIVSVCLTAMGLYAPKHRLRSTEEIARLVVGILVAVTLLAVGSSILSRQTRPIVWLTSGILCVISLIVLRAVHSRFVEHTVFQRRVLVYGAGKRAAALLKLRRRSDRRGFEFISFVLAPGDGQGLDDRRVIELEESLLELAQSRDIDEIVIAMDDRRRGFPVRELLDCKLAGISVVELPAFLERETGRISVDIVNPSGLIFSEGFRVNKWRWFTGRISDLIGSGILLLLASPILIATALAIWLEDGRPILYRQRRVGLRGREFVLYKFRSMQKDAEAEGIAQWATKGDPRVTRVGAVIRKLRLDELPQLFNVLRGEMSLVGPRPERPEFVVSLAERIPYYHERHTVKPGITGWAQVRYPYGSSEADAKAKLDYDLYYVKHQSLVFDLMVLLQTAEVILWSKGAR